MSAFPLSLHKAALRQCSRIRGLERERDREMRKNKLFSVERSKVATELGFRQAVFGI